MPESHHEEALRLTAVLQQLSEAPSVQKAGGRLITSAGEESALLGILQEVQETVLPRDLHFCAAAQSELVLTVAERRITRMRLVEEGALSQNLLKDGSADDLAQVAASLVAFCADASEIWVRAELISDHLAVDAVGLSLSALKSHLGGVDGAAVEPISLDAAVSGSKDFALAVLDSNAAEPDQIIGQRDLGASLRLLDAELLRDGVGKDRLSIWSGAMPDDPSILLAVRNQRRIWLAFEADNLDACLACWIEAFAPAP